MSARWIAVCAVALLLVFVLGFKVSSGSGIQPGYFEKKEAPAYGVGGGEGSGADISQDAEEHYKKLYADDEEEQ